MRAGLWNHTITWHLQLVEASLLRNGNWLELQNLYLKVHLPALKRNASSVKWWLKSWRIGVFRKTLWSKFKQLIWNRGNWWIYSKYILCILSLHIHFLVFLLIIVSTKGRINDAMNKKFSYFLFLFILKSQIAKIN